MVAIAERSTKGTEDGIVVISYLTTQQGAVVKSLATDASSRWEGACIDISDMAAGLYFVRMYNGQKSYTCKFSKQ